MKRPLRAALLSFALIAASCGTLIAATPTFQHDVLPVMQQRCIGCHGEQASGGLDLRTLESVMKGSSGGPAVSPGHPESSVLWEKIASDAMPMGGDPLTDAEKNLIRDWITNGLFPTRDVAADDAAKAQQARERAKSYWAFQRPVKHAVPQVEHIAQVRTAIDAFILEKLEAAGTSLNPEAERETLIRRAYLDLTGLPPSPEQVQAFVKDDSARAYEDVVDQLLDSPAYGERWARHWMDVAGYADGNGFLGDEPRTHSWQYRDWVIRALNADMPYDQFLVDQVAGDQIADWKMGERLSPEAIEKLQATGFLRLPADGTDNQTIYEIDKQWDAFWGMTEVTTKALMGININCFRCHDHKFDPFLQKDYYRMMGIYQSVYDPDPTFPPKDTHWLPANIGSGAWPARFVPNATQEEMDRYLELQKAGPSFRDVFRKRNEAKTKWLKEQFESLDEPLRSQMLEIADIKAGDRTEAQVELFNTESGKFEISNEELSKLSPELAELEKQADENATKAAAAKPELIWAAWDVTTEPNPTHVLVRGNYEAPGDVVEPGVPVILDDPDNPFTIPEQPEGSAKTGRRLAFAKWLTRPEHPLTARVIANRVWQYHFGEGIVATPDDFGSQGAAPTHPELLDWLAVGLVEHDWSLKWLHRQIMLSNVYRQTSKTDHAKYLMDEPNKLLSRWQPRRLEAEVVRDSVLQVSGLLNDTMYGEPIALCSAPDGSYLPETSGRIDGENLRGFDFTPPPCEEPTGELDPQRDPNRRSIYLQTRRLAVAGFLGAFDLPLMDTNVSVRFRSAVPGQALSSLHNPLMMKASESLAERASAEAGNDSVGKIRRAIELVYSRSASEAEIAFGFSQIDKQEDKDKGFRLFCQALLGSSDFLYID